MFKKDEKLPSILNAPTLSPSDKSQIVQEIQRHMGAQDKGDTVKNFLKTLADNNRLGILPGVCDKFTTLMGAARGEMDLTVTSAAVNAPNNHLTGLLLKSPFAETRQQGAAAVGGSGCKIRVQSGQETESGFQSKTYLPPKPHD